MADGAVEVLAADDAAEAPVLRDQDSALTVALTGDERVGDGLVRPDGAGGAST